MSEKFCLIRGVEEQARSPKTKYQVFEIRLNADVLMAVIPFVNADVFLEDISKTNPTNKASVLRVVKEYAGEIE